jgi:Ca2+-binding EF-hand superfamily protein
MCFFVQKTNKVLEQIFMNSIKEVDTDNDGIIDFNEFKQLMLSVQ